MYPYAQWAENHLTVHRKSGAEWLVSCPNPRHEDNNPSCNFNVSKGVYHCFACGFGARVDDEEANSLEIQIDTLRVRLSKREDATVETDRILDESMLQRYQIPHPYWRQDRGLTDETIARFELGYDPISDAATIPERSPMGQLIGVTRRMLHPENPRDKYRYTKGFRAASNLFGSWLDEDFSTVAMVEGAIDAMKIWQAGHPALAIYGAQISKWHLDTMLLLGVRKVIWFGDDDAAGLNAKRRSRGYWERRNSYRYHPDTDMSRHFLTYHVTDHQGQKDAGSMTDDQIRAALESVEPYTERPNTKFKRETVPPHIKLRQIKRRYELQ